MSGNQSTFPLVGCPWKFDQHGRSGAWVSERYPHTAKIVDDRCIVRSMHSEAVNHDPAMTLMQTGAPLPSRPSAGAWVSYGLGSENENLPGFIVLVSKRPADQPLSSRLWDSGFLPSQYQGVQFRTGKDPVLFLNDPKGMPPEMTRRFGAPNSDGPATARDTSAGRATSAASTTAAPTRSGWPEQA